LTGGPHVAAAFMQRNMPDAAGSAPPPIDHDRRQGVGQHVEPKAIFKWLDVDVGGEGTKLRVADEGAMLLGAIKDRRAQMVAIVGPARYVRLRAVGRCRAHTHTP